MTRSIVHPSTLFRPFSGDTPGIRPRFAEASGAFPEERFPPQPAFGDAYRGRVARGYREMRQHRVVIAGLARNVSEILPSTIGRIERLGRLFRDYRVVIYENDSRDDTSEQLSQWSARNSRVVVLSETRCDPLNRANRCPHRGERMAYYRNQYLDYIAALHREFDEVIVVDTDLAGGWSYDGIANTFGHADWDFVGSYGVIYRRSGWSPNHLVQYDAWAFRLDEQFQPLTTEEVNNMLWHRGSPLVLVTSCFGGLGVYRLPAILSARHQGGDCEHIALHRGMRKNGYRRLFVNPSQITLYGRHHRSFDACVSLCQRAVALLGVSAPPLWL